MTGKERAKGGGGAKTVDKATKKEDGGEIETAGEKERRIEYSRMDTERCVYDPAETRVTAC